MKNQEKIAIKSFAWLLLLLQSFNCLSQQPGEPGYYKQDTGFKAAVNKIDNFLLATGASGGILIAKKGEVVLRKGYGWANERLQVPMTSNAVFDIGSVTKQFTATAILKLEEQGRLRVADSITRFLKEVPADKQPITIHQLLTHTAGFEPDIFEYSRERPTRMEELNKTLNSKLKSQPGAKYSYSNAGYNLLAIIIEIASGNTYEGYLSENLFKPANMMKTGLLIPRFTKNELALGYDISGELAINEKLWTKDGRPNWVARGAGGTLSSLEELYKWHLALEGEKILSDKSKHKLFTSYVSEDRKGSSYYGYGWAIFKTPRGTKLITHNGFNGVFFTDFYRYVDEDIVVIYFTNERSTISRAVFGLIPDALFGKELPGFPSQKIMLASPDLNRYAGDYQLPSGEKIVLHVNKGHLEVNSMDLSVVKLLTVFPELKDEENVHAIEHRTKNIIEHIALDSFEAISNLTYYEGAFEAEKNYWKDRFAQWKERFGDYKKSEVIGSVQDGANLVTYVFLQFEHGSAIVQCKEREDKKFYIGTSNLLLPSHYRFIPKSKTEFEVYNYTLKTSTLVNFNVGVKNVVDGLTTQNGNKGFYAQKL